MGQEKPVMAQWGLHPIVRLYILFISIVVAAT